jgi:thiamine biosynthesis protein ThiS
VEITVNGERREVAPGTTVQHLLDALRVERRACAVEINRELVPRSLHPARALQPGDAVEIVTLVGGG